MNAETETRKGKALSGVLFVQLPPKLKLAFKIACAEAGISMHEVITSFVQEMVDGLKPKKEDE